MALYIQEESNESYTPYIDFSGKSERWSVQNELYNAETNPGVDKKNELPDTFTVAIDIENIQQGWMLWSQSETGWSCDWQLWDGKPPAKPSSEHKEAYRVLMWSSKLFGEATKLVAFRKDTLGVKKFLQKLNAETEKEQGKGKVPVIEISRAKSEKFPNGKSSAIPQFTIKQWVDRGDKFVEGVDNDDGQTSQLAPPPPPAPKVVEDIGDTFNENEV
tara:strand:+ start:32 stop:682 length:651 start_codon:yes stop_codon:yes gene_type:complete